jgi:predicted nucleotidyltransferase
MDTVVRLGQSFIDNLCQLSALLEEGEIPFAVIGASALLLHGVDLGRTTRDLDLAVVIEGGLTAAQPLFQAAGLSTTSIEHRFRMIDGSEIDILAIDPAWTPAHEIRLADGDRICAVGLPDAVRESVDIELDACQVSVAPLCLLIAVKLHAATADDRPHDLEDACAALLSYEQTGDRRFTIDYELFGSLEFETAGAFLAGLDTAEIASVQTTKPVNMAIDKLLTHAHLSDRFAEGFARRGLVLAYQKGLEQASGGTLRFNP